MKRAHLADSDVGEDAQPLLGMRMMWILPRELVIPRGSFHDTAEMAPTDVDAYAGKN